MNDEKIIYFLKQRGPSLPVEIGKMLGYNSLLTNAVLSELIINGKVKKSIKPIGSSLIYYLPGQENAMRERLVSELSIPEKNLLRKIKDLGFIREYQLTPHERQFINNIKDFTKIIKKEGEVLIAYFAFQEENLKSIKVPEPVKKPQPRAELFAKERVAAESDFESKVINWLNRTGEVMNSKKVIKGREFDYLLRVNNFTGEQTFFVKAKNKKKLNEHDLSMIYTQALKLKKPAILITNGSLTRKAEKWAKEHTGELLKVIKL